MTEESDRMLMLLQELATLKETEKQNGNARSAANCKRMNEIKTEMKQLAAKKKGTAEP